jgi:hypothetical protein
VGRWGSSRDKQFIQLGEPPSHRVFLPKTYSIKRSAWSRLPRETPVRGTAVPTFCDNHYKPSKRWATSSSSLFFPRPGHVVRPGRHRGRHPQVTLQMERKRSTRRRHASRSADPRRPSCEMACLVTCNFTAQRASERGGPHTYPIVDLAFGAFRRYGFSRNRAGRR